MRVPPQEIELPDLVSEKNEYADREYQVEISTEEFTCRCPHTGNPDFALIEVQYRPWEKIVELRSFKLYLQAFRDVGIFHEDVVNRIRDDLVDALYPKWMQVKGKFNLRGGITTSVVSTYSPYDAPYGLPTDLSVSELPDDAVIPGGRGPTREADPTGDA